MILDSADNAQSKRRSKGQVLGKMLGYEPEHQVHIHYFRSLRQRKEAWDAIEMRGWLGMPVQMRINWTAPDSVLAAPMVLDLIRLVWWAKEQGRHGPQGYLGAFFKDGIGCPTHSFPDQMRLLRETLLGSPDDKRKPFDRSAAAAE
jgi:myo-inositol-1-phosphate synthase